ncbi:MAG: murein biosynthesis integral membrane protein MurJ [bacterium]
MKRLFNIFSKENSVRTASVILIITLALSNVLGLLRDRFLAQNIHDFDLDIYYASFRIPDLIFNFLILGTITSAFIPIFSEYLARNDRKGAWHLTNLLINVALAFTIVAAILMAIFMPTVTHLVVPNFDGHRFDETVHYSRLLMLTPIFFSISYILGGVLNSFKRFLVYSIAPLVYNSSIIVGALLAQKFGIEGVVYSVIVGSALHAFIQLPAVMRLGFSYRTVFDFKNNSIKQIVQLMLPRSISMGANQIMLLIFTAIASALAAGSIMAFNFANNIQTMPIVVLGTSFATATFPTLAEKIAKKDFNGFAFYLDRAIRVIALLLIPASIITFILRAQIVRLIFGSGKFTWEDTQMTALTLGLFSISLVAQGLIPLLARAFYAMKNTRTPMFISLVTVAISVIGAYTLPLLNDVIPSTGHYWSLIHSCLTGVAALALAFSIGNFVNVLLLFFYLGKMHPEIYKKEVLSSIGKTIFISLIMGVVVWLTMHSMVNIVDMTRFVGVLTQATVSILAGIVSFLVLGRFFNSEELTWALTRKINGIKSTD